ncbi:hypothetical protein [Streptomyces sp. NBC_00370]|uniref:hypothetical protein n=1 Tax=Streptomyces sp. NBC_00370 TaxID=2975728 RepID=UPI002E261245
MTRDLGEAAAADFRARSARAASVRARHRESDETERARPGPRRCWAGRARRSAIWPQRDAAGAVAGALKRIERQPDLVAPG